MDSVLIHIFHFVGIQGAAVPKMGALSGPAAKHPALTFFVPYRSYNAFSSELPYQIFLRIYPQ